MESTSSWNYKTPGIPDEMFERAENIPITKEEVRAVQISKARLRPGDMIYDVGCGSGSVTVEAALQVGAAGRVTAIDCDEGAIALTRRNVGRFGLSNVSLVRGEAPGCMKGMGRADAVFIGGTGGETAAIIGACRGILKPGGRLVAGTILVETLHAVLQEMEEPGYKSVDVTQVTISKGRKTSTGTMMLARNPVTIVSASRSRS